MDKFKNLLDILKSQCELYGELASILAIEKEAVAKWNVEDTLELNKRKDTIVYKERLLEEARRTSIKKICLIEGKDDMTVSDIIEFLEDEELKAEFADIKIKLLAVMDLLSSESLALKILYRTNISLVNDFFDRLGITAGETYNSPKGKQQGTKSLVDHVG